MRKIDVGNYMIQMRDAKGNLEPKPYNVKDSMVNCLLHPSLQLTGRELLLRDKLATRIEETEIVKGVGHILIEEEDYRKLRQAFEKIEGFTKNDIELVRRVLEAEEIKVEAIDPEGEAKSQKKYIKGRREK
jgi:hypothetical protein